MKLEIVKQKKNPFLKRRELVFKIEDETTPSFDRLKKEIGDDVDLVVVRRINANFGKKIFFAEVLIYDDVEARKRIETIPKKIRKKLKDEEKDKVESLQSKIVDGSASQDGSSVKPADGSAMPEKKEEKKDGD